MAIILLLSLASFVCTFSRQSCPVNGLQHPLLVRQHRKTKTTTPLFPALQWPRYRYQHGSVTTLLKFSLNSDDHDVNEDGVIISSQAGTSSSLKQQLGSPICIYDQITIPKELVVKARNKARNTLATTNVDNPTDDMDNEIVPQQEIIIYDITKLIQQFISENCGKIQCGTITLFNRHTTTSLIINEYESRLLRDMQTTFLQFIPPDLRSYAYQKAQQMGTPFPDPARYYEHNDIHLRPESLEETLRCYENGYNISDPIILQSWRDSEPINAHSHLLCMMIGSPTLTIPIHHNATMQIGTWQSIMLIDFDGPRLGRTIGIQVMGYQ